MTPRLGAACNAHDISYVVGGTEDDRIAADKAFREDIAQVARHANWFIHWLLEEEQPILFDLMETEGRHHFHYAADGVPRTLEQVRALADARIAAGRTA